METDKDRDDSVQDDKFTWAPGDVTVPSCVACARKHAGAATCDAYPDGIPEAILDGSDDHKDPSPGDHGLQYLARG